MASPGQAEHATNYAATMVQEKNLAQGNPIRPPITHSHCNCLWSCFFTPTLSPTFP